MVLVVLHLADIVRNEPNLRRGPFSGGYYCGYRGGYTFSNVFLYVVCAPYSTLLKVKPSLIGNKTVSTRGSSFSFLL